MRWGLTLVELAVVLVLLGVLALTFSSLFLMGVRTERETGLLQVHSLAQDLWDTLGRDVRGAIAVQGHSATGFIVSGVGGCVQYRWNGGRLERRTWTGSCASPTGTFLDVLNPGGLPYAQFCYDNPSLPNAVALMDNPCDTANPDGKKLTLRLQGRDFPLPPLAVSRRTD